MRIIRFFICWALFFISTVLGEGMVRVRLGDLDTSLAWKPYTVKDRGPVLDTGAALRRATGLLLESGTLSNHCAVRVPFKSETWMRFYFRISEWRPEVKRLHGPSLK